MKFAVFAVVVLALAAGVYSSAIPWLAVSGPGGAIAAPGSVAVQATLANGPVAAVNLLPNIIAAPVAVAAAPVAIAAAPAAVIAGQATHVAKTRGAIHVAPLPGHTQSSASLNLQPAPGTL